MLRRAKSTGIYSDHSDAASTNADLVRAIDECCLFVSFFTPLQKECFRGVYWNQLVCPSVCLPSGVSVCVQNTTFCQSTDEGIKSHLVTAQVFSRNSFLNSFIANICTCN